MTDEDDRPEPLVRLARDDGAPPSGLEDRVVAELRRRGLIRGGRFRWHWPARAMLLAASVVAAFAIGRGTASPTVPAEPAGSRWLLLLYEDSAFVAPAGAARAERVEEYRRWGARVRAVDGAELGSDGALIGAGGIVAVGASELTPVGRLAGYFVVTAATAEAANAMAASCPHVRYGGRIVVRPLS